MSEARAGPEGRDRPSAEPVAAGDPLPRVIGPGRFALAVVGLTIATAIFRVPSVIAAKAGSPGATILLWCLGALFAFAGGLVAAELAARVPRAGGEIAFLKAAYGDGAAFVFGWTWLLLVSPASIAAVARTFADYGAALAPISETGRRALTVLIIALHAGLAMASTRLASGWIGAATVAKLAAMGLVAAAAFVFPVTHAVAVRPLDPGAGSAAGLIAATVAVIWAYDGSSQATLAGDVRDPARNLPRGILLGTAIIAGVYLLMNAAYARPLGFAGLATSEAVASDAMGAVFGRTGAVLVAALVMVSAYSCGMVQLMSHPRVTFAMANDGLFFRRAATLSAGSGTPWIAILLHAVMAAILALMGGYGFLLRIEVFAFYPLLAAAYFGAVILRRRDGPPAGWRMPLYPLPVVGYLGLLAVVLVVTLIDDPIALLYAAGTMLVGALVYRGFVRSTRSARHGPA